MTSTTRRRFWIMGVLGLWPWLAFGQISASSSDTQLYVNEELILTVTIANSSAQTLTLEKTEVTLRLGAAATLLDDNGGDCRTNNRRIYTCTYPTISVPAGRPGTTTLQYRVTTGTAVTVTPAIDFNAVIGGVEPINARADAPATTFFDRPTVSFGPVSHGAEPQTSGQVTVRLNGDLIRTLTLPYTVSGTATAGSDYTLDPRGNSTTAKFVFDVPAGAGAVRNAEAVVVVGVSDDTLPEPDETVVFTLTPPPEAPYTVTGPAQATVLIADNEPVTVDITARDTAIGENGGRSEFLILLDKPFGGNGGTIGFTVGGSATAGEDYDPFCCQVTLGPNDTQATLPVVAIDDTLVEGQEDIVVTLDPSDLYQPGARTSATMAINDDDMPALPTASLSGRDLAEPDQAGELVVTLDTPAAGDLTVLYQVSPDSTATADADYGALSGEVLIAQGQTQATVPVPVIDDTQFEGDETVVVTLIPGDGYVTGTPDNVTLTIRDDDPPPQPVVELAVETLGIPEGGSDQIFVSVTFPQSGPAATEPLTVSFARHADSTADDNDIVLEPAQTVTIDPAEGNNAVITITAVDDTQIEGPETAIIALQPSELYLLGASPSVELPIIDNDAVVVDLLASDDTADEDTADPGQFQLTLSEPAGPDGLTVFLDVTGTATMADDAGNGDFEAFPPEVRFAPGETQYLIDVIPIDDPQTEDAETVVLTLREDPAYRPGEVVSATVTIAASDQNVPEVSVIAQDGNASESGSSGAYTLRASRPAGEEGLVIRYSVGGTATVDPDLGEADYEALSGSATIAPGQRETTVIVQPVDDNYREGTETVILKLEPGAGYTLAAEQSATVIIIDDPGDSEPPPGAGAPGTAARSIIIRRMQGNLEQAVRPGDTVELVVQVTDDQDQAQANLPLNWSLNQAGIDAGGTVVSADAATGNDGTARATLATGPFPAVYELTVRATVNDNGGTFEVSETFTLNALLTTLVNPDTPEHAVAASLDALCPGLNRRTTRTTAQQRLLDRCTDLYTAFANNEDTALRQALRALAPEEALAGTSTSFAFSGQQLRNLSRRLMALRRGARGFATNALALRLNGEPLPGLLVQQLFGGTGGAAGDPDDERLNFFLSGEIGIGDRDTTTNESGFDFTSQGVTFGADYRFSDRFTAGAAVGYADTALTLSSDGGNLDAAGLSASAFATYFWRDDIYFDAIVSLGGHDFDQRRRVAYTVGGNDVDETLPSTTDGRTRAASFGAGLASATGNGWSREIFGRLEYIDSRIAAYREAGNSGLEMAIDSQRSDVVSIVLGGNFSKAVSMRWGVLSPQAGFAWEQRLTRAYTITGQFVNDPENHRFAFRSDEPDRGFLRLDLGISAIWRNGLSSFVQYDTTAGRDDLSSDNVSFGLRFNRQF